MLLTAASFSAAERQIVVCRSPDDRFEVVLAHDGEGLPAIQLRDAKTKTILGDQITGGYGLNLEAVADEFNTAAVWSPDSKQVLLKQRGTKWSTEVTLLRFDKGSFVEIKLPDLYPVVLKNIGVSSIYRRAFTSPLRWVNDSTVVLKLEGDCDLPGLKPEESRRWFEYEAIIDLTNTKQPVIKRLALKDHNG
ncbi:MAG: hypothetical protein U1A53_03270 [Prosthecobacter sp.]|nr:hypothetical protein [Prosthecobacter sp.]